MQRKGKTFIVSGPSGVGKSTVLKALFDQQTDLYFSISATTRDPRPGEVDGVHYHFIPAEEFHRMVEEDEFLEYAEYVGNFYGTPKKYVDRAMDDGRDVILDIEIQGANQICAKRPETVRLHSHLSQLRDMLQGDEPVGRKLDFLIQEINRECNTIGSKCSDLTITQDVVNMKAEVEKIREQVQNIE